MSKGPPWAVQRPKEEVGRILLGLHRKGQLVTAQEIREAIRMFPEASISAKEQFLELIEPLLQDALLVPLDVLGDFLCKHAPFTGADWEGIVYLHWHVMERHYTPVAPSSEHVH